MIHSLFTQTMRTTPPLTKVMSLILVVLAFLVHINIISPLSLTYSFYYVKKMQLWRLVTSFFYFEPFSVDVLLHVVFFFRYSKMLEESFMNASEYAYLLMFCSALIFVCANVFRRSLLGNMLSSAITYIWTRRNRTTQVQLLGCILFPAFFLPFVVPVFSFFSERKVPFDEVMGIIVGHVYFYLRFVVKKFGYEPLRTPNWLKRAFGEEIEEPETVNVPSVERLDILEEIAGGAVRKDDEVKNSEKSAEDRAPIRKNGVDDEKIDLCNAEQVNVNEEKTRNDQIDDERDTHTALLEEAVNGAMSDELPDQKMGRETFTNELDDSEPNKEDEVDFFSVSSEENKHLEEVK